MFLGISAMLRRTVQSRPNDVATVCGDRSQSWTEMLDKVTRLAGGLRNAGLLPGERIAIIMQNSDRYLETCLAGAWSGGIITPLNGRWSVDEILYALEDSTPVQLMVDDAHVEIGRTLADLIRETGRSLTLVYCGEEKCPEGFEHYASLCTAEPIEDEDRQGDDLYAIFYTGGTTGRSKGVMLSHANFVSAAIAGVSEGHFHEEGTYLNILPTFHLSSIWPYMACVCTGIPSIIQPSFVPQQVLEAIEKHNVTEMLLVPTMIQMLIEDPAFSAHNTGTMKRMLYGAAPITAALVDRAVKAFPGVEFVQVYGMTELVPPATTLHFRHLQGEGRRLGRNRTIGRATYGIEVEIVDQDNNPVPSGTFGEIRARGPNRMLGYWNRPDATESAIVDGWMHTGDGGYMDESGFIFLTDRIKDMIITGGENVYSVEVENCVTQHPAVAQCAVIGIPDKKWGERVQACVVLHPGSNAGEELEQDIVEHCRAHIAHYKCPRTVVFRDALPLTGAGKVLKRALRDEYAPA